MLILIQKGKNVCCIFFRKFHCIFVKKYIAFFGKFCCIFIVKSCCVVVRKFCFIAMPLLLMIDNHRRSLNRRVWVAWRFCKLEGIKLDSSLDGRDDLGGQCGRALQKEEHDTCLSHESLYFSQS